MRNFIVIGLCVSAAILSSWAFYEPAAIAAPSKPRTVIKATLTAVAYDAAGNSTVSAPVTVNIKR